MTEISSENSDHSRTIVTTIVADDGSKVVVENV